MVMQRAGFADVLDPIFRKVTLATFDAWKPVSIYDKVLNINSSTRQSEKDSYVAPFGAMETKVDLANITYRDFVQGYDKTYTHSTFALGGIVSMEMYEDDQFGIMKKIPASLSRSAIHNIEQNAANLFNNAFNAAYAQCGDGKELCATDHPNPTGAAVLRNELSTAADLSVTSLKQMLIDFANQVDYNGFPLNAKPSILLIPNDLKYTALEILKSVGLANTADNNMNSISDANLQLVTWSYITRSTSFWLLAPKGQHELNFFWRKKPTLRNFDDPDSLNMKTNIHQRFSVGASSPFGIFGSPGK